MTILLILEMVFLGAYVAVSERILVRLFVQIRGRYKEEEDKIGNNNENIFGD